ncbi:MAG TPA: phosphoethanolamine transferase [Desulfoprunum sp.]|nr:phosphoethanolamine transferase [Desulfoprunum sp.]
MKNVLRRSAVQILLGLVVALTLFLPGLLFNMFAEIPLTWFEGKYLWMFWAFGIVLCACPSFRLSAAVLTGLAVLELTQFASLAFTHEYITPFAIGLMLIEYLDVAESTVANSVHFLYVPLVVLLPYLLCLEILRRTWTFSFKSRWFVIFVIAFLAFPLVRIKTHTDRDDIVNFFPTATNPTLVNTLNSYSLYFGVLLPESLFGGTVRAEFPEYEIRETDIPPSPLTIVLVMGESLTPNHMSLYGYGRKTTPFLEELAGDPGFVHRKGYSAASATRAALPMFYTLQYHPLDENRLRRQDSNLFRLAKQHGFRTWYLSAQNSNCLNGVDLDPIDVMITADTRPELFEREKDEGLLQLVREVPSGGKNFIVVHQRNVHLPYQANIEHRPAFQRFPTEELPFEDSTINAYDNAVLYADYLYQQLLQELRQKTDGPLYVFFTSDHGEKLGENGHWGHDRLDLVSAVVPIMFYARGGDGRYLREMRDKPPATHYQLGKMIARMLGYDIRNPAEEDGIVYVNGVASLGRSGYMRFRVTDNGERRDLRVIQSPFVTVAGKKPGQETGTTQSIPR